MGKMIIDSGALKNIFEEEAQSTGDDLLVIQTLTRRIDICTNDLRDTWLEIIDVIARAERPTREQLIRFSGIIDRVGEAMIAIGEYLTRTSERGIAYNERVIDVVKAGEDIPDPAVQSAP